MKLELKHLTPYLPYGLKGNYEVSEVVPTAKFELRNKELRTDNIDFFLSYAKPILRPLSDLTKEFDFNGKKIIPLIEMGFQNKKEIKESLIYVINELHVPYCEFEKLLQWHFDLFGLIEKGLAIDVNLLPQSSE